MFQDEPFGRLLQKLSCIRDERFDILERFKEKHRALQKVLRCSLVLATADLQRTRKTIDEFRSHVNKMVNNLDEGSLGFSVFRFWLFFRMVFRLLCRKRRFFVFGVHCGLRNLCFFECGC